MGTSFNTRIQGGIHTYRAESGLDLELLQYSGIHTGYGLLSLLRLLHEHFFLSTIWEKSVKAKLSGSILVP